MVGVDINEVLIYMTFNLYLCRVEKTNLVRRDS